MQQGEMTERTPTPTMTYIPGSNTLENVGLLSGASTGDFGFAAIKAAVNALEAAGVEARDSFS
jgi:hypothetical protein